MPSKRVKGSRWSVEGAFLNAGELLSQISRCVSKEELNVSFSKGPKELQEGDDLERGHLLP